MDICLLDNIHGVGLVNPKNTLFLWYNWETGQDLCKSGFDNLRLDTVLSKKDRELVESEVIRISDNWYKIEGKDFSKFKNLSLGSLYEWELYIQLNLFILITLCIKRVVEKYSPKILYHHLSPDSDIERIVRTAASHYNILLEHTQGKTLQAKELIATNFGTYSRPRKKWLGALLNSVVNMLSSFVRKNKWKSNILFHAGNPQLTPILRMWLRSNPSHGAVIDLQSRPPLDILVKFIKKGGCFIRRSFYSKSDLPHIHKKWKMLSSDKKYIEFMSLEKMRLTDILTPLLDKIVLSRFNLDAAVYENYISALKLNRVGCVVLPNDCVLRQKLAVYAAKELRIQTVVIQHGLVGQSKDKDKLLADYSLLWSEKTKLLCARHGVQLNKLAATGAPSLDAHYNKSARPTTGKIQNVLVLTTNSPFIHASSPTYGEDLILTIMKTLERFNQFTVTVKIHPSESVEYYQKLIGNFKCKIKKNRSVQELLPETDLVIAGLTSALIDARLKKKPTILVFEEVFYKEAEMWPPFNREGGLIVATNEQELESAIKNIMNSPNLDTSQHIEFDDYIGALDGKSSMRVFEFITYLATEHKNKSNRLA